MKCFICLPMRERRDGEYIAQHKLCEDYAKTLGYDTVVGCVTSENYDHRKPARDRDALKALGNTLGLISECDAVVFSNDWNTARGCKVVHDACEAYGIKQVYAP